MERNIFSYRTSATLSLTITLVMHLLFLILIWFGRTVMLSQDMQDHRQGPELGWEWFFLNMLSVFVFTFLMFQLNFRILKADLKKHRILVIVILSVVSSFILSALLVHIGIWFFGLKLGEHYWQNLFGNQVKDLFLTLVVIFISQILYLSYKKQQIALENEKLMAENMKSRYETLKNQVDPHFLFNTLNTLNTMIKIDADRAQEYIQKMSSVFRYTLQNKEETLLEDELKFTLDYCLLMQIRYGDSLVFDIRTDKKYNNYLMVPLSIQTLVENAIKHNVITNRQPLTISIYTDDNQRLTVVNPIQVKKEAEQGEGIGLANLTERYRLHFQQEPEVSCIDNTFKVSLPLIKPNNL